MALDHGTGVSRTLSPQERAFAAVIWQKGKPPLDSELNLMSSVDWERFRQYVTSVMPSGFFMDPTRSEFDFKFDTNWTSHFHLGVPRAARGVHDADEKQPVVWANVNGWIIPVAGTDIATATGVHNVIKLYPPPASDIRVDMVFLEAWQTLVQPNPSTLNKPTASTIWKHGNVKFGGTNITDDLEDPNIGIETTKRVQVQYRLRVYGSGVGSGSGVNLAAHPDGLGDPNILGQGANTSAPVAGMQWSNMREELGDPSLWRAGDGDPNSSLGTVDGYTYAIPVCAVFRRNSNVYVAVTASGNPNQNGAFLRQPGATLLPNPLNGDVVLLQATLSEFLSPDAGKLVAYQVGVTNLSGSGLADGALVLFSTFLRIGDEIIGISAVNLNTGKITIPVGGRGRWGTAATGHDTGSNITFFNTRPDGLFADEIASQDVLDLRRAVNPGDWDYTRLLAHNVAALAKGKLRTAWKMSNPGDTAGPVVHEVVDMYAANETHPNDTDTADGPDGIRTIWSDAATIQPDVTLLLDHEATRDADGNVGFTNPTFDASVDWDVGADFKPIGFLNMGAGGVAGWTNGSSIHLFLGGTDGNGGARGTFRAAGVRDVRFVTPNEYWKSGYPVVDSNHGNQHPVTLRFIGEKAYQAPPDNLSAPNKAMYGGPLYPWRENRFERPFIVLGGVLNSVLRYTNVAVSNLSTFVDVFGVTRYTINLATAGLNFDTVGVFRGTSVRDTDPADVSVPFLRGQRTFYGMLTNDGADETGASSEVYLLTFGDPSGVNNNGAFRVVGAGTSGYTNLSGASAGMLVLEPLSADFAGWSATGSGNFLTVDFRSQHHNADDTQNYAASKLADLVVCLTDIGGEDLRGTPWDLEVADTLALPQDAGNANKRTAESKAILNLTMLYHPGRAAMTRVPDEVVRFAMQTEGESLGTYLRRSPSAIDTTFSVVGTPTAETYWPPVHVQTWNRLPALGWHAPLAPAYGGAVVGYTESEREHELFIDRGSKTALFRPFRNRDMTLKALTWTELPAGQCLLGTYVYPDATAKDSLQILTDGGGGAGKEMGFILPQEFTPRFGRQDIPYRVLNQGAAPSTLGFMPGINHLFTDVTDLTNPVFDIIGGKANTGGTDVKSLFFITKTSEVPYCQPLSNYGPQLRSVYGARKTSDIDPNTGDAAKAVIAALKAVNSSDLGRGLKGIQMPPYVGIARLYGVYEYEDYTNKGGTTFNVDRYTMEPNPAINLLREDADQQTLFILQDGAQDYTESLNDHTYIIPSNVLDLTRVPVAAGQHGGYVEGVTVFEDFDYVVEATVFFFAQGFINKNNIVLVRKRGGVFSVGPNLDGDNPELENVPMCIPSPAGVNDRFYSAYNRTVYQGDPFMTRDGLARQTADYENRYGRLTPSQAWLLRTAVQQFDSAGNYVPQMENERGFEVLASMDFYTTLGTGKIGGALFPGTPLDVGYIGYNDGYATSRMPQAEDSVDWRIEPRAFTAGQKTNPSRASASLEILNGASLTNANNRGSVFTVTFELLDGTSQVLWFAKDATTSTIIQIETGALPEDVIVAGTGPETTITHFANQNFGILKPEVGFLTSVINVGDVTTAEYLTDQWNVTVTPDQAYTNALGSVIFTGHVNVVGPVASLQLVAHYTSGFPAFNAYALASGDNVRSATINFPVIAGHSNAIAPFTWAGGGLNPTTDIALVNFPDNTDWNILPSAYILNATTIRVVLTNISAGATPDLAPALFVITVLKNVDPLAYEIDLTSVPLTITRTRQAVTAQGAATALVATVNSHPRLLRTVTALHEGTPKVLLNAVASGAEGNGITVTIQRTPVPALTIFGPQALPISQTLRLAVPYSNALPAGHQITSTHLFGGVDIPVNAGNGTNQMALTGMTERFPLGVLVQDSDFMCENPLGDTASAMNSAMSGLRPIQTLMPLTEGGEEYTRFMGAPGELVAMADVKIAPYSHAAWTSDSGDSATKKFRLYRGGGAAYVLGGENPGGPIDWVSESFPKSDQAVLKSGVLAVRALLVRNFYEEALPAENMAVQSQGDEVQMVLLTYAHVGTGLLTDGLTLDGILSPAGYGEGYAAADRYRCMGRPMVRGYSRYIPDPAAVTLAVYPENQRGQE